MGGRRAFPFPPSFSSLLSLSRLSLSLSLSLLILLLTCSFAFLCHYHLPGMREEKRRKSLSPHYIVLTFFFACFLPHFFGTFFGIGRGKLLSQ